MKKTVLMPIAVDSILLVANPATAAPERNPLAASKRRGGAR